MWMVRQAARRNTLEQFLRILTVYPFRCQLCTHRFLSFLGKPTVNPHRDYERILVRYPVRFSSAFSEEPAKEEEGAVVDLSIRGCTVTSPIPVPKDACLRLKIELTDQDSLITIDGAIVRSTNDKRFGLEFVKVRSEEEERLRGIIQSRLFGRPY